MMKPDIDRQIAMLQNEKKSEVMVNGVLQPSDGKHKIQIVPVIVVDGDFKKMFGWGMEIMVFTTYRATLKKWYRNLELCRGGVTSLLGRLRSQVL